MKNLSKHIAVGSLLLVAIVAASFVNRQNVIKNESSAASKEEISNAAPVITTPKSALQIADSICREVGVPFALVKEIGQNESGWRYIQNTNGGTDNGDLQVIDQTYWYWYDRLGLEGGKTRRNYLNVGIYYLKSLHDKYDSWEKTRFAYGRGHWRTPDTWTCLEEKFMGKIDFSQYDK
ncbi:MAG: hypothetical protein P8N47_00750 [Bacteroidia bacterium]|nr:hypothetical protein [Bacteroidia bacterium]